MRIVVFVIAALAAGAAEARCVRSLDPDCWAEEQAQERRAHDAEMWLLGERQAAEQAEMRRQMELQNALETLRRR